MSNSSGKKLYLSPPHLNGDEINYISNAIESNWVAPLGPHVDAFEEEVSQYVGVNHAAALSSGTAALHLALKILGVKKGDHVFCSDLTFIASANAIRYLDAIPVFIDAEPASWNMCPKALLKAFDSYSPKAVIVTDLYGQSANYENLSEICNAHKIQLIEDAAESLGAEFQGRKCGSFGDMAILSFNGNKIITTSGGGMLLSNNKNYIEEAKKLSTQAREDAIHYEHNRVGYNYRLSNILAAIGRAQLKSLDDYVNKRRDIFNYYKNQLDNFDQIEFMPELENSISTRWLTVLRFQDFSYNDIKSLVEKFSLENIEAKPLWKPMHLQPVFKGLSFISSQDPDGFSGELFQQGICLPSGSALNTDEQGLIIEVIKNFLN